MPLIKCGLACVGAAMILGLLGIDGLAHPGVAGVTWTGTVSRIVTRHCAACHGATGNARPSLSDYDEARLASQSIKQAVISRRMPRWDAVPGFGDFSNDPGLTPNEIDLLAEWADAGGPYGDEAPSPQAVHPPLVEQPDLLLRVTSKHRIEDTRVTFELKTELETDRWVRGWEFQPGNPSLIRTATLALASGDTLATWVPGNAVTFLPDGIAQRLPAKSRILLTIHYRQPEGPAVDASGVALYFSDRPARELKRRVLSCGSTRLTESIDALAIRPAIGSSGRSLTILAQRRDRRIEPLGWFRDYSDDHAQTYWFSRPLRLPVGTSIQVNAAHGYCGAELEYVVGSQGFRPRAAPHASLALDIAAASGYRCPMHPEVRADAPGFCVRCRMALAPVGARIEGRYALDVELVPGTLPAADRSTLRLVVREPGTDTIVRRFENVHERPFHLFVVSDDLNEFSHVHPESRPDGSLELPAPRMRSGSYVLFADFLPAGGTPQLIHKTVITRLDKAPRPPQIVTDYREKTDRQLRVRLEAESGELAAGKPTLLALVLEDPVTGAPITDLEPYLGAWGHLFIVSADLADAVHSHPITPLTSPGGPKVVFRQRFPRSGSYRLWAQFQRGGQVATVSFTVAVSGPH